MDCWMVRFVIKYNKMLDILGGIHCRISSTFLYV